MKEINYPHSLGLLYSLSPIFRFKVNSEYKVMGLAPYGKPIYKSLIMDNLIDLKNDGSFRLNQNIDYSTGLTMINKKFIIFLVLKQDQKMTIFRLNTWI